MRQEWEGVELLIAAFQCQRGLGDHLTREPEILSNLLKGIVGQERKGSRFYCVPWASRPLIPAIQ